MSGRNWKKLAQDNLVFLTVIPLLVGIHWGWVKIQENPDLVDPKDRRELPVISMYKNLYKKVLGETPVEATTIAEHRESLEE